VVAGAELDCVGACEGVLSVDDVEELAGDVDEVAAEDEELAVVFFTGLCVAFATASFRADAFAVALLAVEVFAVVDAAADRTTFVLPVAISATISAVPAVATAAVQRVMRLSRRRLAARMLVSRLCRSGVMETGDHPDLAKDVEMPVNPLRSAASSRAGYPVRRIALYA